MDADIVILEAVEKVVKKHTEEVVNPNYQKITHNISVELDQMELLHDVGKKPKQGYRHVRVTIGGVTPYFILLPKNSMQKLFLNLNKQQEAC